jgi:hypothetical protein
MILDALRQQREMNTKNNYENMTISNIDENHPLYAILTQLTEGNLKITQMLEDMEILHKFLDNLNITFWMAAKGVIPDLNDLSDNESCYFEPTEKSFNIVKRKWSESKKADLKLRLQEAYKKETDKAIKQSLKQMISEIKA